MGFVSVYLHHSGWVNYALDTEVQQSIHSQSDSKGFMVIGSLHLAGFCLCSSFAIAVNVVLVSYYCFHLFSI